MGGPGNGRPESSLFTLILQNIFEQKCIQFNVAYFAIDYHHHLNSALLLLCLKTLEII